MGQEENKESKASGKLLSAAEAAAQLGVTQADLTRLRRQGKLPGVRGKWGRWSYHAEALAAVLTESPSPEQPAAEKTAPRAQSLADVLMELSSKTPRPESEEEHSHSEQAPLIRMANAILVQAIDAGASDIHLEPDFRYLGVRFRIDGILHEIMHIPNHITGPLIRRYKVMSDINLLEQRLPQAGSVPLKYAGTDYDMRVSTLPSRYGENVTMHILRGSDM